eukprot:225809-Pyramimonas_sp.AAC.1
MFQAGGACGRRPRPRRWRHLQSPLFSPCAVRDPHGARVSVECPAAACPMQAPFHRGLGSRL